MSFAPIICYHRIIPSGDKASKFEMNEDKFLEQMDTLAKHGFSSFSLGGGNNAASPASRKVVITFDDGYSSDYHLALPILREFGFTAVFFVTAGLIGKQGYMTPEEVRELASSGASVQSHSYNHLMLAGLTREEIAYELRKSKEVLEKITGAEVGYISVPGGSVSEAVLEEASKAGYRGVYTSKPGYRLRKLGDLAIFERFMVHSGTPPDDVLKIAMKDPLLHGKTVVLHLMKKLGKRILKRKRGRETGN